MFMNLIVMKSLLQRLRNGNAEAVVPNPYPMLAFCVLMLLAQVYLAVVVFPIYTMATVLLIVAVLSPTLYHRCMLTRRIVRQGRGPSPHPLTRR